MPCTATRSPGNAPLCRRATVLLRRRLDCPVSERAPPRERPCVANIPNARDFQILAIAKISPPALATRVVLAAVPPDSHTLPLLPRRNTRPASVDYPRHFMSGNTGILNAGPGAFFREYVTVANTISLHLDTHLHRGWESRVRRSRNLLRVWKSGPPSSVRYS